MKFKLNHFKKLYGRLGCLTDVERLPEFTLETPNIFFYTNTGCIPNLTYDVLQKITTDNITMQYPLNNIYQLIEKIQVSQNSLHSFVGQPEHVSYCIVQDPLYRFPEGFHRSNTASIKTLSGIVHVSSERYMEYIEDLQPDIYTSLYDCETSLSSSTKRTVNAVHTTNSAFSHCYKAHTSSPVLKNKGLIAPIVGGYHLSLRERCAEYMSNYAVLGYLIDGLFADGRRVHEIPAESVMKIISHTVNFLPGERVRIVHGAWDPHIVLKMVKAGIDIFDTSFPILNSENGRALNFNIDVPNLLDDNVNLYSKLPENNIKEQNGLLEETNVENGQVNGVKYNGADDRIKKPKMSSSVSSNQNFTEIKCDNPFSISLYDTKYFDDLMPLMDNCTCLTCRNHTRAYIHHLLMTKELLAAVLLTIHNLHHYIQFFQCIREQLRKQLLQN